MRIQMKIRLLGVTDEDPLEVIDEDPLEVLEEE